MRPELAQAMEEAAAELHEAEREYSRLIEEGHVLNGKISNAFAEQRAAKEKFEETCFLLLKEGL